MADFTCYKAGCHGPHFKRGLCDWHYSIWRSTRVRSVMALAPSLVERFWWLVAVTQDCWIWTGATNAAGYGFVNKAGTTIRAHRFAYELLVGPIPPGFEIDHLCRVRNCVNPDHLDVVTHQVNVDRAHKLRGADNPNGAKTHCPQGHPYAGDNLRKWQGRRYCRVCQAANLKAFRSRRKAA